MPNIEQIKSLVRWALAWASGIATGYLTAKGWLTSEQLAQVSSFFSSETVVSIIVAAGSALWGLWVHSRANAVAVVAAAPGTTVSPAGTQITLVDPDLAKAAAAAATSVTGKK